MDRLLVVASLLAATLLRSIFFLADPFYTLRVMPAVVCGLVYGLPFPFLNMAFVYFFFVVRRVAKIQQISSFQSHKRRMQILVTMTAIETGVQIFADVSRSLGFRWPLLVMCKVFFVSWGIVLSLAFMTWV